MHNAQIGKNQIINSFEIAKIYSEPHEKIVKHLEYLYNVSIENHGESEDFADHNIFPTIKDGVKYFELNRLGYELFQMSPIDNQTEKWRQIYLRLWTEHHQPEAQK